MATTRFYLDLRGKAKDGKGSIVITIYHNRTTAMIPTGIRVKPNEWDGSHVVRVDGYDAINARLAEKISSVDRSIAYLSIDSNRFDSMTAPQIKKAITEKKVAKPTHLVSDLFIEYLATDIKEGTKEIYRATLAKVLAFGGKTLKMENINLKWLHQFEMFLAKTQGVNGRAIYLRSLRAVCNYALHTNVISSYPFQNFSVRQEPTRKRSVSVELFRKFIDYPTSGRNAMFRDFLLMFYLIGVNSKDLLLARKDSIVNDRFEYVREKTHKKYSVRIEPEAWNLIEKYHGKNYLLEAMDHCKHYKSFAHEMNDHLKMIGEEIVEMIPDTEDLFGTPHLQKTIKPVIPGISTYYARHCWATFAYEAGIPLDTISQALGHSAGNRTTLIYVKFDQEKVDKANKRVIDFVLNQSVQSESV